MEPVLHADSVEVRFYPRDGSVFLDTHYLIKGVAGAIFWKLAREYVSNRRHEFSMRELRLAGHELRLPELQDNLGVRLLLLQRRLAERDAAMQIHKTGRGRFRIDVRRPLRLMELPDPARTSTMPSPSDRPEGRAVTVSTGTHPRASATRFPMCLMRAAPARTC